MNGDYYLLNAFWIGAVLCITGILLPRLLTVLRFIIVMCLPFGLIASYHVTQDVIAAVRKMREDEAAPPDNVTPIPKRKAKR